MKDFRSGRRTDYLFLTIKFKYFLKVIRITWCMSQNVPYCWLPRPCYQFMQGCFINDFQCIIYDIKLQNLQGLIYRYIYKTRCFELMTHTKKIVLIKIVWGLWNVKSGFLSHRLKCRHGDFLPVYSKNWEYQQVAELGPAMNTTGWLIMTAYQL